MPTQRSGFGAKTAKSIAATSAGKQNVADRGKGADSVVRAVSGAELAIWLDADEITGTAEGGELTTWLKKDGDGASPIADETKRPTYRGAGYNSRPAVLFDATNDSFKWGTGTSGNGIIAADMAANTIIAVNISAVASTDKMIFEMGTGYNQGSRSLAMYYQGFANRFVTGMGSADDFDEQTVDDCVPNILNVCISRFDRDLVAHAALKTYINGQPANTEGQDVGPDNDDDTDWSGQPCYLGSRNNGSLPFNGHIREFIVLKRALTIGEACRIGKALMNKSGVTRMYAA